MQCVLVVSTRFFSACYYAVIVADRSPRVDIIATPLACTCFCTRGVKGKRQGEMKAEREAGRGRQRPSGSEGNERTKRERVRDKYKYIFKKADVLCVCVGNTRGASQLLVPKR